MWLIPCWPCYVRSPVVVAQFLVTEGTYSHDDGPRRVGRTGSASPAPTRRRVGAIKPSLVPADVRFALDRGEIETANLMEQIAIDLEELTRQRLPEAFEKGLSSMPFKTRMLTAARRLSATIEPGDVRRRVENECDTVRSIGALAVGLDGSSGTLRRLERLRSFADDEHFGVREWAWIGLREERGPEVVELLGDLTRWTTADSPNVRRFASEITRPSGVWTPHLKTLHADPSLADELLDSLSCDASRYVQLSVGNWMNDLRNTAPSFVRNRCTRWLSEHPNDKGTRAICNRALRRIGIE